MLESIDVFAAGIHHPNALPQHSKSIIKKYTDNDIAITYIDESVDEQSSTQATGSSVTRTTSSLGHLAVSEALEEALTEKYSYKEHSMQTSANRTTTYTEGTTPGPATRTINKAHRRTKSCLTLPSNKNNLASTRLSRSVSFSNKIVAVATYSNSDYSRGLDVAQHYKSLPAREKFLIKQEIRSATSDVNGLTQTTKDNIKYTCMFLLLAILLGLQRAYLSE
ncbi:hypothetical protein SARC_12874 [Sphaeroforma arctica JP610]|uniref:Uncharacterized protein n=1 Tax=Sphaeroforma arctica JP610 TaxID=667725 RepID=A0A0L0FCV5_9EUKA|nr:hypothetical protein SARC_12874 [Sphaeroforma arctica JP610]KNC74584.1 hypothetical protein SARC_12874 [Sphaeroforma arctica JP610]|eukprot:XP_014148486.1 hypothetical protein SARC_12874 [Sphaeroforma arctica JP610]